MKELDDVILACLLEELPSEYAFIVTPQQAALLGAHTNCHATYLIGHVMCGRAVHVVVAPLEEVVLYDLQVLAGVHELELILGLARCLSGAHKG
jgi:hypothetical protein